MTFKVTAILGTPFVVIDNKKYIMNLDVYPVYKVTVKVNPPVKYYYILNGIEESFDRETNGDTLIDFFDRKITVKKHPLLPLAFNESPLQKKSKLYDGNYKSFFFNYMHILCEFFIYI